MAHARSSVERSRPARPGTKRRTGITIQLVVASTSSPTALRNGTCSHWKWKRKSSTNTKNVTTVSIRKTAICVNISALPELVAELRATTACGFERLHDLFRQPFLLEHLERSLGGPAFRSHLPSELARRVRGLRRKLRRAEHHLHGELQRGLLLQPELLAGGGQLLDEPEHVRGAARRKRGHRIEQPLVLHPDHLADGAQNGFGLLPFLRVHFGQRVERGDPRADQRRRVGHASNELAVPPEPARQRIDAHAGGDADNELFTRFSGQASE